jgi:hypothetical protein
MHTYASCSDLLKQSVVQGVLGDYGYGHQAAEMADNSILIITSYLSLLEVALEIMDWIDLA